MSKALRYICKAIMLQSGGFQTVLFDNAELIGGAEGETYEGRKDTALKLLPGHGYEIDKHYDFPAPTVAVEDYPPEEPPEE